jgi:hypothetical protein
MGGQGGLADLAAAGCQAQAWCLSTRQQDGALQWLFGADPKYQALHISRRLAFFLICLA